MLEEVASVKRQRVASDFEHLFICTPKAFCDCIVDFFKQITVKCPSAGALRGIDVAADEVLMRESLSCLSVLMPKDCGEQS